MKRLKTKFYLLELNEANKRFDGFLKVEESEPKENDYGNKTYINITHFDKTGMIKFNTFHIDCRYMPDYTITKATRKFVKNYYGENLKKLTLLKQSKIIA